MKNKTLLFIMLLAICVIPMGVNAKDLNVTLKSIEFVEKGGNASQVSDPSIDGLNINLNMRFEKLNDYITYKLLVENKDKEDYNLVTNLDDEYVKYEFSTTNIKKNTTTEIKITAKYVKELPDNLKDQQITKVIKLSISDKNGNILNPKTGQNFYIIIALLLIVGLITIFVIKKKKSKELGFIALILLLVPVSVLSAKDLSITINSTYEIKDISGLRYKGIKLDSERDMNILKSKIDNFCLIDNNVENNSGLVIDYEFETGFDNDNEFKFIYPSVGDSIGIECSASIETDTETGKSRIVVGECSNNPEAPFSNYTFNGDKLTSSARISEYAQSELCPKLRSILEDIGSECVKKLIGEP